MRVLDVGAGTGNAALPAAAAGADVVATDLTAELLAVGERHARERGLTLRWEVADAQALPFADGEFDAVLSSIGAIFAPDQAATARELLRVCRPGGIVVMANWTPDGGVGRFFELLGRYEAAGDDDGPSPLAWGVPVHVTALLEGADVQTEPRRLRLAFTGPADAVAAYYRRYFPPVVAVMADLDDVRADRLEREIADLYAAKDTAPPGGPPCYELEYLLVTRPVGRSSSGRHLHVHQRQRREPARVEPLGDEVHPLLRGLHPGVDQAAQPVGDAPQLADRGVVDARLRRPDHRHPGRGPVVLLRDADRVRLARVGVPGGVVVAQLQQGAVEAGHVAVELELGEVVVGEHLRPAREAPRVRHQRARPQGLDQGGVRIGPGDDADEVLAAAQRVLQVVEDGGERAQLRRLAAVEAAHGVQGGACPVPRRCSPPRPRTLVPGGRAR